MEENPLPIIHEPQAHESIEDYIRRYSDENLKAILCHPTLSLQFGKNVMNWSEYIGKQHAETDELQILWMEMKQMKNYGRLQQFVEELRFVREKLLIAMDDYATYIERYAKTLSIMRLVCSVGDIAGSAVGILMKDTAFDYSDIAFKTAAVLGFTGTLSTVTETYLLINATDDILHQIRRDQNLYDPIEEWFKQTDRLKQAMLNVFPFEKTVNLLQDFSNAVESEIQGVDLLVNFFRTVIDIDISQLRNTRFLHNILSLLSIPDIAELFKLVIFHLNPVHLEIGKMMLQLTNNSVKHMFYQHIPSLSPCKQTFWSPPVWGRISFNFLSMLQAFKTLKRSEISIIASEMRLLRKHLERQLETLDKITNYAESRQKEAERYSMLKKLFQ